MQKRNMASSIIEPLNTPQAIWTAWTVKKAVKEGYKASGWVFKAVSIISKNISMVPWRVETLDGNPIKNHPLTKLLITPNPSYSRQDFFELISAWQQLSGEAYSKIIFVNGIPTELWPISPDRITPKISRNLVQLIGSYEVIDKNGLKSVSTEFTPENIISFRFLDPSNPIRGIGPLQVAAKAVDIDIEQLNWNKSAMQNRGILDGVFSFKEKLDKTAYDVVKQKIRELFQGTDNARDIGVIGSDAKYQRLSLTPAEMDFITSRKFNREEIFIIFGVPPQLAGAQESSTYNNFNTSRVIFWETTLIPILDDLKSTFNRVLSPWLDDGLVINYDLSGIPALKKDIKEKAEIAKIYSEMGVPIKQLTEMFKLGVPEYEGWDKSIKTQNAPIQQRGAEAKALMLKKWEQRNIQDEIDKKEELSQKAIRRFVIGLNAQKKAVFNAIEENKDIAGILSNNSDKMKAAILKTYKNTANIFAGTVLVDNRGANIDFETREIDPNIDGAIDDFLLRENVILTELSLINSSTVSSILDAIINGEDEGQTITQIQQSILDSGTFSPERALRIARTATGTAQSIGQMAGAIQVGATKKTWNDSNFEVRAIHQARDGETVGINERFSTQNGGSPRWPLDQETTAADRINCRCSMTFSI